MTLAVYVLFLHFLADFVFQSDSMAKNKSKSWGWLTVHIGAYSFVLFSGVVIGAAAGVCALSPDALRWLALNGAAHFAVDAVTSRINSRLYAAGRNHAFFVGIGADQFIHAATLLLTLGMLK